MNERCIGKISKLINPSKKAICKTKYFINKSKAKYLKCQYPSVLSSSYLKRDVQSFVKCFYLIFL